MAAFTPGNIVVYRVGTGVGALGSAATAVFLDEYTPAGALVQSIPMPVADAGANQTLTASGTATSEGYLTLSVDGRYLILPGYDAAPGTASITTSLSTAIPRVIGRVGADGTIDTTTALTTNGFSGGNIRSVASIDGSAFWADGSNTGVVYATLGATSGTVIASTPNNLRSISIFDNQLYIGSGAGTVRMGTVGTGPPPTTSGQTITSLPGFPTATNQSNQFYFADLTAAVAGVDTLYIADDRGAGGGLLKYSLVGGSWILNGTAAGSLRGLTGSTSATTVTLYGTTTATSANAIVSLIDTGGYNAAFSTTAFTTVATAAANTVFRGIAFAPQAAASPGTLAIADASVAEGNSGTTPLSFTVSRTGGTSGAVSATWTITFGSADAADLDGAQLLTGSVSFANGESSKQIVVNVAGDTTFEGDETFTVTLSAPTGGATLGDAAATGTITNDDPPPPVPGELSIADSSVTEGDAGATQISFTVTRASGDDGAVGATWTISFGSADADDFDGAQSLTGTVEFADGETSKNILIDIAGDTDVEADETFTVTLSTPTGGATLGDAEATGTITNDDFVVPQPGTLSIADASVAEGNAGTTPISFTVTRASGDDGAVSATWTATFGSADAADFAPAQVFTGTVDFADGETVKTITLDVKGDVTPEIDDTFTVTLSAPTGGAALGDDAATGTITNDDGPIPVPGTLSIADASVAEGNEGTRPITFTVTRASGDDGAVGATWNVTFGTANSVDFGSGQAFSGTVAFADGETSKTITLNIAGDTVIEPDETFTVTLSAPTGGASLGDDSAAGTIVNNDSTVFINEFHYDDAGTDAGEAIEVAGPAGTNLSGWSIVLYNFTNGQSYSTINLSGLIPNQDDGYGTLSFLATGLQNGPSDGIALVNGAGIVVQFLSYEGTLVATNGPANGMTSTDIGVSEEPAVADGFSLQLVGTGAVYDDFTWAAAKASTFGAVNTSQDFLGSTATGLVSVADTSVTEGNSGTSNLIFTVERAGGIGQTASVDYVISLGSANAADLAPGAVLSGTITFNPGEASAQVLVSIQGDVTGEPNETLSIALSNAVGNITVTDANAVGTIVNDDLINAAIYEIQGASHISPLLGQSVVTTGIVTGVDSNGFYIQDPVGDANDATSDGVFVFTSTAPTVAVGDNVQVTGTVSEFTAGANALSVTEITSPAIIVNSTGNPLPAPVVIGTGGRTPPTEVYDDDNYTSFDPATDALDFYESMEGMRVTIKAPLVVSNTNSFGETYVLASGGAGATSVSARDGVTISDGDLNPERIQIDNDANLSPAGYNPSYTQGDILSDVTGILNYANTSYEVLVTGPVTTTTDVTLDRETSTLTGDATHLTIASFNVENRDPNDPQAEFDRLGDDIVNHLNSPDIIGLQEIQDADGAGNGANLSGQATADKLIAAIIAAGGPTYQYVEIAPTTPNSTGGEPNGNIRNGYLYNPARVTYVAGSAELVPGAAFDGTRHPLAASFIFNGETVKVINVHFTSRGGSEDLFGEHQPPNNAGDSARLAQAQAVRAYIDGLAAGDPELNIVTLGDFNSFYFEAPLQSIQSGGVMTNLYDLLPVEERYSYIFEGNLQALDNILVSPNLVLTAMLDVVHLHSEQLDAPPRPTDHDQPLARILITANDIIIGSAGNDVRASGAGNDFFFLGDGGDDSAKGGTGNDVFFFGPAMTSADKANGESGTDQVALQGDYSFGLIFGTEVVGIESLAILPGSDVRFGDPGTSFYDYDITTVNENVAPGITMFIDANRLRLGEDFTFDGSAETDGKFFIYGGGGTDDLTGGEQNDVFLFGAGLQWSMADMVDGGLGTDQLALRGDYTITFCACQLTSIESIGLLSAFDTRFGALGFDYDYDLTMNDGNVALGQQMTVDGGALRSVETLTFDGSDEQDGSFRVFGGAGADSIAGSQGDDILVGGLGADYLKGDGGADTYRYRSAAESTSTGYDTLDGFDYNSDSLDLPGVHDSYSAINGGTLDSGNFDTDLGNAMTGVLDPSEAIFFTPDAGDLAGKIFLVVDQNGLAGYQAGEDFVMDVSATAPPPGPIYPDFIV